MGQYCGKLKDGRLTLVELLRKDKSFRRYAAGIERALSTFDAAEQEWADYIAFLGRLLKVRKLAVRFLISTHRLWHRLSKGTISRSMFFLKRRPSRFDWRSA